MSSEAQDRKLSKKSEHDADLAVAADDGDIRHFVRV